MAKAENKGHEYTLAVNVVLDESGSMKHFQLGTVKAVNSLLEKLALSLTPAVVSVSVYGNRFATIIDKQPIYKLPKIGVSDYNPMGGTPTFHAVKRAIDDLDDISAALKVVIILTDGDAGDGPEGGYADKVKATIAERQKLGGWLFIYLGANQRAEVKARELNIRKEHALTYAMGDVEKTLLAAAEAALMYGATGDAAEAAFRKATA